MLWNFGGCREISTVRAPASARHTAASVAEDPAPMTATSFPARWRKS